MCVILIFMIHFLCDFTLIRLEHICISYQSYQGNLFLFVTQSLTSHLTFYIQKYIYGYILVEYFYFSQL